MNKYDVLNVVGEGAYGVVLKCKNKDTNEVVAIKKFKESEEDEAVRKTTLREVKILRIMKHENIVQLKEAFKRKGKLYLVFEFIEKSMLDILEEKSSGIEPENVRLLTFQLLRALEYCHRKDVIHRDIKPENLLIDPMDYALRLCDFGFARTVQGDQPLTDYVATRWYRAPELLLGSEHYGKDVDLWALGCIMGELTDGQPLFAGESEVDQLAVIQKVLGPLTQEHMEMFLRNPRFLGIQYGDFSRPETLEKRYVRKMKPPQMALLKAVLRMEPRQRLPAREALRAPWFEGIKLPRSLRPLSQSQSQGTRTRPESSSSVAAERSIMGKDLASQVPALTRHASGGNGWQHPSQPEAVPVTSIPSPDPWQQQQQRPHEPRAIAPPLEPRGGGHIDQHSGSHDQHLAEPPRDWRKYTSDDGMRSVDSRLRENLLVPEQPRSVRDDRGFRGEERASRIDERFGRDEREQRGLQEQPQQPLHINPAAMQPQPPPPQQHHPGRGNPYVLPWEEPSTHDESSLPLEFSIMSRDVSLQYVDSDDKGAVDGRRLRQARRAPTNEISSVSSSGPGSVDWDMGRLPGDRGTPNNADRSGAPFGFPAGGSTSKPGSRGGPVGGHVASSMAYFGAFGPGPPGPNPGGEGGDRRDRSQGGLATSRHGATAGTGGSEEWPSTQVRPMRLREQDPEEDKTGFQRRKPSRHAGGPGNMPGPAASRRSPELGDTWPPQEDMLDIAVRQIQLGGGVGGPSRWGAAGAAVDWPGLDRVPVGGGPSSGSQSELAPVRDPRGLTFDARPPSQPTHEQRLLAGLGRRGDLSGNFHGH